MHNVYRSIKKTVCSVSHRCRSGFSSRLISVTVALLLIFSLCTLPFSVSASSVHGYTVKKEFFPNDVVWSDDVTGNYENTGRVIRNSAQLSFTTDFYNYQFPTNTSITNNSILTFTYDLNGENFKQFQQNYLRIDFLLYKEYVFNNALDLIRFEIGGTIYSVGASDGVITSVGGVNYSDNPDVYWRTGFVIDLNKISGYGVNTDLQIKCSGASDSYLQSDNWRIWVSPLVYYGYSETSAAEKETFTGPDSSAADQLEQQEGALRDQVDNQKSNILGLLDFQFSDFIGLQASMLAISNIYDSLVLRIPFLGALIGISVCVGLCGFILSIMGSFIRGGKK